MVDGARHLHERHHRAPERRRGLPPRDRTPRTLIRIADRAKDLVKSGGEWISTPELEGALMEHPAVAEAAVVAVADEKWTERPMAVVAFRPGMTASADELRDFIAPKVARWWLPERVEIVEAIPKTAVGKFNKRALREQFDAASSDIPDSSKAN